MLALAAQTSTRISIMRAGIYLDTVSEPGSFDSHSGLTSQVKSTFFSFAKIQNPFLRRQQQQAEVLSIQSTIRDTQPR